MVQDSPREVGKLLFEGVSVSWGTQRNCLL